MSTNGANSRVPRLTFVTLTLCMYNIQHTPWHYGSLGFVDISDKERKLNT